MAGRLREKRINSKREEKEDSPSSCPSSGGYSSLVSVNRSTAATSRRPLSLSLSLGSGTFRFLPLRRFRVYSCCSPRFSSRRPQRTPHADGHGATHRDIMRRDVRGLGTNQHSRNFGFSGNERASRRPRSFERERTASHYPAHWKHTHHRSQVRVVSTSGENRPDGYE